MPDDIDRLCDGACLENQPTPDLFKECATFAAAIEKNDEFIRFQCQRDFRSCPGPTLPAGNDDVARKDIDIVSRAAHVREDCDIDGSGYRTPVFGRKNPDGEPAGGLRAFACGVHHAAVSSSGQDDPAFIGKGRTQSECIANVDGARIFAGTHNSDYRSTSHACQIRFDWVAGCSSALSKKKDISLSLDDRPSAVWVSNPTQETVLGWEQLFDTGTIVQSVTLAQASIIISGARFP